MREGRGLGKCFAGCVLLQGSLAGGGGVEPPSLSLHVWAKNAVCKWETADAVGFDVGF